MCFKNKIRIYAPNPSNTSAFERGIGDKSWFFSSWMCTILVLYSLLALRLNWIGNGLLIEKDMYSTLLLVQSLKSDAKEPTRGHGLNNLATNYISLVVKYFNNEEGKLLYVSSGHAKNINWTFFNYQVAKVSFPSWTGLFHVIFFHSLYQPFSGICILLCHECIFGKEIVYPLKQGENLKFRPTKPFSRKNSFTRRRPAVVLACT